LRATLAQSVEQLIRNQQVVGSNPTGGSRKSSKFKEFSVHLDSHSVELPPIVRKLSEFVKRRDARGFEKTAGQTQAAKSGETGRQPHSTRSRN